MCKQVFKNNRERGLLSKFSTREGVDQRIHGAITVAEPKKDLEQDGRYIT